MLQIWIDKKSSDWRLQLILQFLHFASWAAVKWTAKLEHNVSFQLRQFLVWKVVFAF